MFEFGFTEEQEMWREVVRDFTNKEIKPIAAKIDEEAKIPEKLIKQLGELGALGIAFPEEYGGGGFGEIGYCISQEEIARGCMSTATMIGAHQSIGANVIYLGGNEEQKQKLINKLESDVYFDGDEIKIKLQKAIDGIKDKEISKLLSYSKNKLSEIKATIDREVNNKNYNLVSMALIHVVSKYDVGNDYNAYSCPMVKMKWIQNTSKVSEVHNPYAPNMPNCGSQDSNYK